MLLLWLIAALFLADKADCQEISIGHTDRQNTEGAHQEEDKVQQNNDKSFWQIAWGKKGRDALLLGMWSLHADGTGEYFGDGRNNDQNHLLGIQYYGLTAGTFINSKDDRAYYTGLAREVYSHNFSKNTRFDLSYKFGLLFGYGDDLMNVAGISVFGGVYLGISWKRAGLDIGLIPVGIITANFRIDIDDLFRLGSF